MISDFLLVFFLGLAGFIYVAVREGESGIQRLFGVFGKGIRDLFNSQWTRRSLFNDSRYFLILAGVVLLLIGNVKNLAVMGPAAYYRFLTHPSTQNTMKDTLDCLNNQVKLYKLLQDEAKEYSSTYTPGPVYRTEKGMRCPHGDEEYSIDNEGYLFCKKHGGLKQFNRFEPLPMSGEVK